MWSGSELDQTIGRVLDCISKGATALSDAGATVYTMSNAIQNQGISNLLHSEARKQNTMLPETACGPGPHAMTRFEPRDDEEKLAVLQKRLERAMHEQDASRVRQLASELDELEAHGLTARQAADGVHTPPAAFDATAQTVSVRYTDPTNTTRKTNAHAARDAMRSESRMPRPPWSTATAPNADDIPRAGCARHASAAFSFPHACFCHRHLYAHPLHTIPVDIRGGYPACPALPDDSDNEAASATGWAGTSMPWCQCAAFMQKPGLMCPPFASSPFTVPYPPRRNLMEQHTSGPDMEQHASGLEERHAREPSMGHFSTVAMTRSSGGATRAHEAEDPHSLHATWSPSSETHESPM